MSSLPPYDANYWEATAIEPVFDYKCADYFGALTIMGLTFPENPEFTPLDKIWSSVRKRGNEKYNVDVAALFMIRPETISCSLLLNCANYEDEIAVRKEANARFKETFQLLMDDFIGAIRCFLDDPINGYGPYCKYVCSCKEDEIDAMVCDKMLSKFLFSVNLKTEEDEAEKAKRREKTAKVLESPKSK